MRAVVTGRKNKVGQCPSADGSLLSELCMDMCNDDSQCYENQKCCPTGCGRICLHPKPVTGENEFILCGHTCKTLF